MFNYILPQNEVLRILQQKKQTWSRGRDSYTNNHTYSCLDAAVVDATVKNPKCSREQANLSPGGYVPIETWKPWSTTSVQGKQTYKGALETYFAKCFEAGWPLSLLLNLFLTNQLALDILVGFSSHSLASWWSTLATTAFKRARLGLWPEKRSQTWENVTQPSTNENLSPSLIIKN